ncbi:MAG: TonB-dependent receptor [Acidobacteriota bacterium]
MTHKHLALRTFAIVLLAALLATLVAQGQTVTGAITGTVVDNSGAVVLGADVMLVNEATGATRRAVTKETGTFIFVAVPPATYTIAVEMAGFRRHERTGIILPANERLALGNIELSLGQVTETVTVVAQGAGVNTESADNTALLSQSQLRDVMIRGRDVMNLLKILPGVSQLAGGADSLGGRYGSTSPFISGTRSRWNNITLDGQQAGDIHLLEAFSSTTSVDAMAEVKVVMNAYLPEYGPNPGGSVTMITKSGTKEFHGNAYWFKRHENLNAKDFFANRSGLQKPIYRFSNFGFTLGGPAYIPNKFNRNKDKLFFFYSHEEWRTRVPQSLLRFTMPTELERRGDFSQTLDQSNRLVTVNDPLTGRPFPGNVIPANRIYHDGQALLNVLPLPNSLDRTRTLGAYNYEFQDFQDVPKRGQMLKLDIRPTDRDTITLRPKRWWANTGAYTALAGFFGVPLAYHHYRYEHRAANVSWTRIISPSVVNEFTAGFWGAKELGFPQQEGEFDPMLRSTHGIALKQFSPQNNPYGFIPEMIFSGIPSPPNFTIDARTPIDCGDEVFQLSNSLSVIKRGHTWKFGFYLQRNWSSEGIRANSFNGRLDFGRDVNNPLDANWPFATALLGNFRSYTEPTAKVRASGKSMLVEWFAQDTWKATRRLTLSYGARFSWLTPYRLRTGQGAALALDRYVFSKAPRLYEPAINPAGRREARDPVSGVFVPAVFIGAFVPGSGDPANGTVMGTDSTYPEGFRVQQPVQVAPRFGFAYDVFGGGRTAIRGGFGINKRALESSGDYINPAATNPPVIFSPQIFYGSMDTFLGASGALFPSAINAWQRDDIVPSSYNWSFGIQQNIGLATMLDVAYIGNVGRHLLQVVNLNTLPYGARFLPQNADPTGPTRALPDDFFRPYPGYGGISYRETAGTSNYNALQVAANRRFARGAQFGLAYTWSKAMGTSAQDGGGIARYISPRVWNYGPLNYDQTHMLVLNYLWDLPKATKLWNNAVVRHVLDNWQVSGITTFASGVPGGIGLSTTDGADISGGGDGTRVVVVAAPQLPRGERSFDRWFNTAAFARPARGTFGNAAATSFRGPGINNWDATLMKNFPLKSETRFLRLRCELYNTFNHTQFSGVDSTARFDPAGNQVNARFGQVTSTRSPRIIQFSLGLYF